MQPKIPQKENLLQSNRFLTHQPTFNPTSTPVFAEVKFKQREGGVNVLYPRQTPSQPMVSGDLIKNSVPDASGSITRSCFNWMVSAVRLVRRPIWFLCLFTAVLVAIIPTLRTSTQLSGFLFHAHLHQSPAFTSIICPLGLCKSEGLASPAPNKPHDLTPWADGARVIEEFTSPMFNEKGKGWWNLWGKDPSTVHWAGPIVVLDPHLSCWSFEGSSGLITLQLIGNATITSVQMAHPVEVHLLKFAPQDFIVWALVDSDSFSVKEIPHHVTPPPNLERLVSNGLYPINLRTFSFEVTSHPAGQSFAIDAGALESYGGRVDKVMFHLLGNWGAKRTCVYHLCVFGGL